MNQAGTKKKRIEGASEKVLGESRGKKSKKKGSTRAEGEIELEA